MRHRVVTPPTEEPVTLAEAKSYLRVTHNHEDELITSQISSARRLCENAARMAFVEQIQEVIYSLPSYSGDTAFFLTNRVDDPDHINEGLLLPRQPVSEVTAIEVYRDATSPTPVPSNAFQFTAESRRVNWIPEFFVPLLPINDYLRVTYKCGLPKADFRTQFPDILEAIKITTATLYDERGYSKQGLPPAAWQLISPYWTSPTYHR